MKKDVKTIAILAGLGAAAYFLLKKADGVFNPAVLGKEGPVKEIAPLPAKRPFNVPAGEGIERPPVRITYRGGGGFPTPTRTPRPGLPINTDTGQPFRSKTALTHQLQGLESMLKRYKIAAKDKQTLHDSTATEQGGLAVVNWYNTRIPEIESKIAAMKAGQGA